MVYIIMTIVYIASLALFLRATYELGYSKAKQELMLKNFKKLNDKLDEDIPVVNNHVNCTNEDKADYLSREITIGYRTEDYYGI